MDTDSERLCRDISDKTNGVCILSFSRGKDSICAWLRLRKYFKRIIPFHCCSVPGLGFVERSLTYFEQTFETPILRYWHPHCLRAIANLVWQDPEAEPAIDIMSLPTDIGPFDIPDLIRQEQDCEDAWCAYGISMFDSISRRAKVVESMGRYPDIRVFYPCFDLKPTDVVKTINEAGIKLPEDYRFARRSFGGVPEYGVIHSLPKYAPEDFESIRTVYPMILAEFARQEFRKILPRRGRRSESATPQPNGDGNPPPASQSTAEHNPQPEAMP